MSSDSTDQRILNLEVALAHLQHDLEQMNSVVIDQQKQIESLKALLQRVEHQVNEAKEPPEKRNPLDERPPHY